jgi:hypothetical protein
MLIVVFELTVVIKPIISRNVFLETDIVLEQQIWEPHPRTSSMMAETKGENFVPSSSTVQFVA